MYFMYCTIYTVHSTFSVYNQDPLYPLYTSALICKLYNVYTCICMHRDTMLYTMLSV